MGDDLVIESSERLGDGGFLVLRRYKLRNRRPDGSTSDLYACDFVERPVGLDAVAVAIYRRAGDTVEVLLRSALRPPLALGRDVKLAIPEEPRSPRAFEIVAGLIETSDDGLEGVRTRAAAEVFEEAGYQVEPSALVSLGASTLPMPGVIPERLYLFAVEVAAGAVPEIPEGDGSAMEEGAEIIWRPLGAAIAACAAGELEDTKTELALRRLADRLA
jgi:ADP-ribose pyrophosphatase